MALALDAFAGTDRPAAMSVTIAAEVTARPEVLAERRPAVVARFALKADPGIVEPADIDPRLVVIMAAEVDPCFVVARRARR